jgi:hypothetical protein
LSLRIAAGRPDSRNVRSKTEKAYLRKDTGNDDSHNRDVETVNQNPEP